MSDLCAEDIVVRFDDSSPAEISETTLNATLTLKQVEPESSAVCADQTDQPSPSINWSDQMVEGDGTGRMTSSGALELGRRLLAAARDGDTTTVLDLMAKGAPFTTDWLGTSPLHLAAANNQSGVCAILLRAGVSRDSRTKVERTPLHLAAYWGHAPTAQLLLENGADVNCRDMLGMTPLHWAVERGHLSCAQVLLCNGADPLVISRFRTTPRQLAQEAGCEMLKLVEEALSSREAGECMKSIVNDEDKEDETVIPTEFVPVEGRVEYNNTNERKKKSQSESQHNSSQDKSPEESGAAKLLRSHGITLLPTDDGNTVLNAIQSGRTILLSDAGKLMLKESETISTPKSTSSGTPMVLTATPVRTTPRPGVKIFTLGNNSKMTINKIANSDQQIKYVTLPQDGKATSPSKLLKVVKTKKQQSTVIPISALRRLQKSGAAGGAYKILMNKGNLHKLIANANKANVVEVGEEQVQQVQQVEATPMEQSEDENVVVVPEQFLRSTDPEYLRAQLLAAHGALHRANTQLAACRMRLAQYETIA